MGALEEVHCRFQGFTCSEKLQEQQTTEWMSERGRDRKSEGWGHLPNLGREWGVDCGFLSIGCFAVTASSAATVLSICSERRGWIECLHPSLPARTACSSYVTKGQVQDSHPRCSAPALVFHAPLSDLWPQPAEL